MTDVSPSDFAVVIYREDDVWEAEVLPTALTENLDGLILALRQQPGIGGAIGLAAVGDDFFVALRVLGNHVSVFLSDVTASVDWPLARQVLDYLDIPVPEDEDLDQVLPVGDMSIFADLGVDEMELGALSGDLDLFHDDVLGAFRGVQHCCAVRAALSQVGPASVESPSGRGRTPRKLVNAQLIRGAPPAWQTPPREPNPRRSHAWLHPPRPMATSRYPERESPRPRQP
jgi:putative tRNA adenosine deaminase-associated protein